MMHLSTESALELALKYFYILCVFQITRTHIRNARASLYNLTSCILSSLGYCEPIWSYILVIYLFVCRIPTSPCVCLILTPWMSDSQHTPVGSLCLLFSGTKYSLTLLFNITFFDLFHILFDWDDSRDQVYKLLTETTLHRLCHEISYHILCRAPL